MNLWLTAFQILICLTVWLLSFCLPHSCPSHPDPSLMLYFQSGWIQQTQVSDVTDCADLRSPGWRAGGYQSLRDSPGYSPSSPSQVNTDFRKFRFSFFCLFFLQLTGTNQVLHINQHQYSKPTSNDIRRKQC